MCTFALSFCDVLGIAISFPFAFLITFAFSLAFAFCFTLTFTLPLPVSLAVSFSFFFLMHGGCPLAIITHKRPDHRQVSVHGEPKFIEGQQPYV